MYLLLDLLLLNFVIGLTLYLTTGNLERNFSEYAIYFIQTNICWSIASVFFSKRNVYLQNGFVKRCKRITQRVFTFTLLSVAFFYLFVPNNTERLFFVEFTFLFYVIKLNYYWAFSIYLNDRRRKGYHTNRALIVGVNNTTHHLRKLIDNNPILGFQFVGFVCSKIKKEEDVIGSLDDLVNLIDKFRVEMVFITQSLFGNVQNARKYLEVCHRNGIRIRVIPENQQRIENELNIESIGNLKVINPQEIPLDDVMARFIKRVFDLFFSMFFLVFISTWLFPILALLIKLNSSGPVFFAQERTGINNKVFLCYKFRSMHLNDHANLLQSRPNDVRITTIGHFMRKTNLDELPQFVNVFLGQMSVAGPRPHMLKHTHVYSELIGHYMIRQYVKPGLTGWAQVNGYRGETSELWKMEKRVEYDMMYIKNWSFWWDLKIILQTVIAKKTYLNAG